MDKGNERIKLVDQFISKSDELAEWLYGNAYNCVLSNWPSNPLRIRLAVTYFYIALGHHKSIVLLTSHHCYGSAFALVRILVQAYVRGLWMLSCASATEFEYFVKKGNFKKSFANMLNDIATKNEIDKELLSTVKNQIWSEASNDIHTGAVQLLRHNTDKGIGINYSDREVIDMLHFVNTFGLFIGCRMNSVSDLTNHESQVFEKISEYNVCADDILRSMNSDA